MIIGSSNSIIDVASFTAGLNRAALGVMRMEVMDKSRQRPISTAWLITDTLILVLPYTMLDHKKTFVRHSTGPERIIEADPISELTTPTNFLKSETPRLLRLRESLPGQALRLAVAGVREFDRLYILHHPQGSMALKMSSGQLQGRDNQRLMYDADTLAGSGGAPVFNERWELVGMHIGSPVKWLWERGMQIPPVDLNLNYGISLAAILDALRSTEAWDEIVQFHNLVDVSAVRKALHDLQDSPKSAASDSVLLRAAVLWSFAPSSFPDDLASQLAGLVVNPADERWVLRATERKRLLRAAGSLSALRIARGNDPVNDSRQQVIDAILAGPPYNIEEVEESALPSWLQAVRWFADVVPSLPTPKEVYQTLERRRVRSRLRDIAGIDFQGRATELAQLTSWFESEKAGPMIVFGIGGIGKSALVAQFAFQLPQKTLILWLDFDRADIAPDDAVSVLRILFEQAAVQIENLTTPQLDATSWEAAATEFGDALVTTGKSAPLLVLDGFEVAQHVLGHQEIWTLLERILERMPRLRILVSGRAPVTHLILGGRKATSHHLEGLADSDVEAWLRASGITDAGVIAQVIELSKGIPLILKLVVQWLKAGGDISSLAEEFPKPIIEGFLYRRILEHVIDPSLKSIARSALVLRRLVPDMILPVLGETLRVSPELDPQELFSRLEREMSLVKDDEGDHLRGRTPSVMLTAGSGVLRLRPEVRSATLKLLEQEDPSHVRAIDERAAAWYATQDINDPVNAAERVYHCLRLGELDEAEEAWRPECASLLLFAQDDLPEDAMAARTWLQQHTAASSAALEAWENDALERIRDALGRQLLRAVPTILAERQERSTTSPLVFYDAWWRWQNGDLAGALALLDDAGEAPSIVGRDRTVLAALLATLSNNRNTADRRLAQLEDETLWEDWNNSTMATLAVRAARIHLAVDLNAELSLLALTSEQDAVELETALMRYLSPVDVILPTLANQLAEPAIVVLETMRSAPDPIQIPVHAASLPSFARQLDEARTATFTESPKLILPLAGDEMTEDVAFNPWQTSDLKQHIALGFDGASQSKERFAEDEGVKCALDLAVLGWRRWHIVTKSLFLAQACQQIICHRESGDALHLAIMGTLALFSGHEHSSFALHFEGQSLSDILDEAMYAKQFIVELAPTVERVSFAVKVFRQMERVYPITVPLADRLEEITANGLGSDDVSRRVQIPRRLLGDLERADLRALCLYLLGPEPLEALVERLAGGK